MAVTVIMAVTVMAVTVIWDRCHRMFTRETRVTAEIRRPLMTRFRCHRRGDRCHEINR